MILMHSNDEDGDISSNEDTHYWQGKSRAPEFEKCVVRMVAVNEDTTAMNSVEPQGR